MSRVTCYFFLLVTSHQFHCHIITMVFGVQTKFKMQNSMLLFLLFFFPNHFSGNFRSGKLVLRFPHFFMLCANKRKKQKHCHDNNYCQQRVKETIPHYLQPLNLSQDARPKGQKIFLVKTCLNIPDIHVPLFRQH